MTTQPTPLKALCTLVVCCLLTESTVAQGLPRARPEDVGLSAAVLERIAPTLQSYVDSGKFPGFLAVVARHGKLAYAASVGWMDVEHQRAMSADAVFRIYSLTKPITSTAIMQLYERGKLRLDDPVSQYIPAFAGVQVYAGGGAATPILRHPDRPVTVADLLTHTSGLTYGFIGNTPADSIYRRAGLNNPRWTLAQLADSLAHLPLAFSPGSRWNYGYSIDVLARVVEVVSGMTFDRSLESAITRLKQMGTNSVAVCYLHSYANASHERATRRAIEHLLPGVYVSLSSEVLPQIKEYERFGTTVVNAYVGPALAVYLGRLEERLKAAGYGRQVLIMQSHGGVAGVADSVRLAAGAVLSGPAGGIAGSRHAARLLSHGDLITFDMGGTSTDIALLQDGEPQLTGDKTVGPSKVALPAIDIHTLGAGGGSIAYVDAGGILHVGPESAGAVPGPACYGRGGTAATVTDANVVLGRIGTRRRLGGSISIDVERARTAVAALAARMERPLGVEALAEGIVTIAVARMTSAIREISIQRGHDPRDFTLIAFGGAGPMHALAMADEIGIPRVLVPRHPGNFSALGLLAADIKHDDVRTRMGLLRERLPALRDAFAEMETAARQQLEREGFAPEQQKLLRSLDLRYRGQAFELNLPVGRGAAEGEAGVLENIEADFHRHHREIYGHSNPQAAIELVNARLTAYGLVPKPAAERHVGSGASLDAALVERRPVWFAGKAHDCPVWDRERLPEGAQVRGPAIVEEFGATTVVPPGWRGTLDGHGNLRFEREARA